MKEIKFTKLLDKVTKDDFSLVGGKGANLGEMIKAGLPVPGGFVVLTTAYERFLQENELEQRIEGLLKRLDKDDFKGLEETSKTIQDLFYNGKIPKDVLAEIAYAYQLIGSPEVAVRSSATAEDLPGTSFAGQYDTYLNIKGKEELIIYVKRCWASLWNHRALSYRLKNNIGNNNLAHGVIIQNLIDAYKSGILFTANPINGRRDQILLNSSWGLGEAIVGGEVNPDQWVLDKKSGKIVEEKPGKKEVMTIRREKGIELTGVPMDKQEEITLSSEEVEEVLKLALDVEAYFGSPQDIEWAYRDGRFYLVQSRPITSLYPMPEPRKGKDGLRVFINVNNYSQAMKEPFTPMGEDVVRSMIGYLVKRFGKKNYQGDRFWWYQNIGGRIFLDITDFMRTEKSWNKFKRKDPNDKDPMTTKALLQLVERNKDEIINPKEAVNLFGMLNPRLIKFLADAAVKYSYGIFSPVTARQKAVKLGEDTVKEFKAQRSKLRTKEEKLAFIEENVGKLITNCFGLLFYVTVSSTYIEKARKILKELLGDASDLHYVEKSVPYSVTTQMGMDILNLAKTFDAKGKRPSPEDKEIKDFLAVYGHRSPVELDVGIPAWKEEPQYVLDLVNAYIDNHNYQEAIDKFDQGKKEAEEAIERIKAKLEARGHKCKAKKTAKMLKDFREMFGIREQSKFVVTQVLSITRDILIEIGEELEKEGRIEGRLDVFYLTIKDIRDNKDLHSIVESNREKYLLDSKRIAPRLLTSTGESIYSAVEKGSKKLSHWYSSITRDL